MFETLSRRNFVAGLLSAPFAAGTATARANDVGAVVETAASEFMAASNAAGVAIGIVGPLGRHIFNFGSADAASGSPVNDQTLFEVGSISKTFTVALTAIAAMQGALSWDDAPGKHIPEIRGPGTDRLTLRDLAINATGGMPLQFPAEAKNWNQVAAWYRAWTPADEPGQVRTYSNPSIGLLGVATARALRADFAESVRRQLLEPLGLNDTHYSVPNSAMNRYAQGRTRDGRPARLSPAILATEAYGLRMTASDLLSWAEAQLGLATQHSTIVEALKATQVGYLRVGPMTQASIWEWYTPPLSSDDLLEGNGESMVFRPRQGERVEALRPPNGALVNKTGGTNGFNAYIAFKPGRGVGLVILANSNHPVSYRLALARRLLDAMGE